MSLASMFKRYTFAVTALLLVLASIVPLIATSKARAYDSPTSRSIKMSSSKNGDTDVTYVVGFTTAQSGASSNIGGLVVDFCSTTPIISDTCTAPSGFDSNFAALALANQSGITGWTVDTTNSTSNTVILTRTASSIATSTAVSIDLGSSGGSDGITNPTTTNTTFYARILTYATGAAAQGYSSTSVGSPVDAGGVAISTAAQLTITAKVQERLTFCIYTSGANCSGGTGSSITLGDANGVLDPATQYTNSSAKFGVASNAGGGVTVRMKGKTLMRTAGCSNGTGQTCSIDPIGGTATAGTSGSEQFGLRLASLGANVTASAPYNGAANNYAFDDANTGSGTNTTYGAPIASQVASAEQSGTLEFVGNISNTTESGIYTTTLTFIATGVY